LMELGLLQVPFFIAKMIIRGNFLTTQSVS
jgi:hypothetical protein